MKTKSILVILATMMAANVQAQNADDALRYANTVPVGSAKFMSVAGSMGAIGGDMSALTVNPASIAVFRRGQLSFTPSWSRSRVESDYFGTSSTVNKNRFKFSEVAGVGVYPTNNDNGCRSINFGVAYNQVANLSRSVSIKGHNSTTSLLDGEASYLNQHPTETTLFYDANLFSEDTLTGRIYTDYQMNNSYGSTQLKTINSTGHIGEWSFAVGGNINDVLYLGGSINVLYLDYEQSARYTETPDDETLPFNQFTYTDYFKTRGSGVNMKIGVIYSPTYNIRLGAAIHTPTLYSLSDDYYSKVESAVWYNDGVSEELKYETAWDNGSCDWELSEPAKFVFSAALVSHTLGSINVDCELVDYSSASLSDAGNYQSSNFDDVNDQIADIYQLGVNMRVGGELIFGALALRGGFGYYGSPYSSDQANSSAKRLVYGAGVGIRGQNVYADFGYTLNTKKESYFLYDCDDSKSELKNQQSIIAVTVGFKF